MIPLSWFLIFSAVLFCLGLFTALTRRNAVGVLMGVEIMLNAANVNILAFWRYLYVQQTNGWVFIVVVIAAAAAEAAVGLALVISAYRQRNSVIADQFNLLKG